jgi:two-component system chemotaxis response regulator CheY
MVAAGSFLRPPSIAARTRGVSMRALVVDDSSAMRAILGMTLKRRGFEILQAKDGMDALNVLGSSGTVELILIDWNMPGMNGLELLRRIRQQSQYAGAQILMVTTETGTGQMSEALSAGANEYIMKPFTPDVVMDKLEMLGL